MECIEARNSLFVFVSLSLSSRSSIASTGFSWLRALRSSHTFCSSSFSRSSSSLRVPDCSMLIVGKMRLSIRRRSRWTSMLPVPLNSSKITSSIRLPVSTIAVAMIVSEPPSSMLRAVAKNRRGRCSALASRPPESTLPDDGMMALWARANRVSESSRMTTSRLCSTRRLAFSMAMLGDWVWRWGGLVEGRGDDLALDGPLHVGDFLRPLVDQQHDEVDLGVVGGDGVGDRLQHHRLARAGRGHDHPALALADRAEQVHDPRGQVLGGVLEPQPLHWVERGKVVEEDLVARRFRPL